MANLEDLNLKLALLQNILFIVVAIALLYTIIFKNDDNKNSMITLPNEYNENFDPETYKNDIFIGNKEKMKDVLCHVLALYNKLEDQKNNKCDIIISNCEKGILLYGESGSGKTYFVRKLTYLIHKLINIKVNLIELRPSDLLGAYFGETEKSLSKNFKRVKNKKYDFSIIFFDEIDGLLLESNDIKCRNVPRTTYSQILNTLDGCNELKNEKYIVIGTTNVPVERFPAEVRRRFSKTIKFEKFTEAELIQIIDDYIKLNKNRECNLLSLDDKNELLHCLTGLTFDKIISKLQNRILKNNIYHSSKYLDKINSVLC